MSGEKLNKVLGSFLPSAVANLNLEQLPSGSQDKGSILFADVSGFTALSERLQSLGREGAEELTRVLNRYFSDMIDILDAFGGDVVKFGGDAMTVLFTGDDGSKATRAAVVMQKAMEPFETLATRGGDCTLAMKIGISWGPFLFAVVGGEDRKEPILSGPPVDESADAEHHATQGWVVLHPNVPVLKDMAGETLDGGYLKLDLEKYANQKMPSGTRPDLLPKGDLGGFLPEGLAASLEHLDADRIGGHRDLVIGFLAFPTLDYVSDAQALKDLQTFTLLLSRHLEQFGGALNKLDMGDKGSKAILLFGAPKALEDPASAALHFGHALFADPNLPDSLADLRLGLNRANVFAGIVGSPNRHEYTVMGDGVNLAARLMQKTAPGQVIASKSVMDGGAQFSGEALEPFAVKGKTEPIYAFLNPHPERRQGQRKSNQPWPDWQAHPKQLEALKAFLQAKSTGSLALINAPEGGGKSFLLQSALAGLSPALKKQTVEVTLSPFHGNLAWSGLVPLAQHLGLGKRKAVQKTYGDLACLLNPFLIGETLEETEASKVMDPQARSQWLQATLVEAMAQGAWCCLVDGGQWLDELSRQTLALWQKGQPENGRVVLAVRDPEGLPEAQQVFDLPAWDGPIVTDLFATHPPADRLDETVADLIVDLTAGNPLAVTTLLTLCEEKDLWRYDVASDLTILKEAEAKELMGGGLGNLVLARFDALPPDLRKFLQLAAVVGSAFRSRVLQALAGDGALEWTDHALSEGWLINQDGRYDLAFSSESVHRALYDSLTFAFKREAHAKVAEFLESEDSQAFGAIASHYLNADAPQASDWLIKAADQAEERYERHAAKRYLNQVIERLEAEEPQEGDQRLLESTFRRGMISAETGDVAQAESDFFLLLEAPHCEEKLAINSARELGFLLVRSGKSDQAEPLLSQAFERANKLGQQNILNACGAAKITFFGMTGQAEKGLDFANKFIETNPAACLPTMNRGNLFQLLGDNERAKSDFNRALTNAQQANNLLWQAMAMISLGWNAVAFGNISKALDWYKQGIAIYLKLYKVQALTAAEGNLGATFHLAGLFSQAITPLNHAKRLGQLFGSLYQNYFFLNGYRDTLLELGSLEEGETMVEQCEKIATEINGPGMLWDSWKGRFHLLFLKQDESINSHLQNLPEGPPHEDVTTTVHFLKSISPTFLPGIPDCFFLNQSSLESFYCRNSADPQDPITILNELDESGRGLDQIRLLKTMAVRKALTPDLRKRFHSFAVNSGSRLWQSWAQEK